MNHKESPREHPKGLPLQLGTIVGDPVPVNGGCKDCEIQPLEEGESVVPGEDSYALDDANGHNADRDVESKVSQAVRLRKARS